MIFENQLSAKLHCHPERSEGSAVSTETIKFAARSLANDYRPTTNDRCSKLSVILPRGFHPFPSRTRKLSPAGPMVLHAKVCGRVGSCRHKTKATFRNECGLFRLGSCLCGAGALARCCC